MRIETTHIIQRLGGVKPKAAGGPGEGLGTADSADFSARAADIRTAIEALKDAPEVREDEIAELQARLAEGGLGVSTEDLARKLLG